MRCLNELVKVSIILLSVLFVSCGGEDPEEFHKPAPKPGTEKPVAKGDVTVKVNTSKAVLTSSLQLSSTLTHHTFMYPSNTAAVARAEGYLIDCLDCIGQFTMDWGAGRTCPSKDSYDFRRLDERVRLIDRLGKKVVLTFCRCPEWMRRDDPSKGVDAAPRPDMYNEFAHMAADFIRHYDGLGLKVYAVNVWSETRGYWSKELNRWELEDYAVLYNHVYDSIKNVNPAVLVGGPFMHIESSPKGKDMSKSDGKISSSDRKALQAFIDNAVAMDFFSIDRNLMENADKTGYSKDDVLKYTSFNGVIHAELREMLSQKFPGMPVWVVDNQCLKGHYETEVEAAGIASMFCWHLLGGASFVDKWQPEDEGKESTDAEQIAPEGLFTHTDTNDGAQPLPTMYVFKAFREHFPPGTAILDATSSDDFVEVLASNKAVMLINKHSRSHKVALTLGNNETQTVELSGFEVKTLTF